MKTPRQKSISYLISLGLICLLASAFAAQFIEPAEANFMPIPIPQPAIVIRADGNIDPQTAPIQRDGNTYTFTDNITGYTIAVEKDNIVLDGGGYELRGTGNSTGVFLKNRNGVTVRNLDVTGFTYGVRLFAEDFMGMNSSNNALYDNVVAGNEYGVYISSSFDNVLRGNRMSNNTYNFWISGGFISERGPGYINDIDDSNTVENKPLVYWVNVENRVVPSNAGYVAFVNCVNVTAAGLSLSHNGQGVLLASTINASVTQNNITKCASGIHLFNSTNTSITQNSLSGNVNAIRGDSSSNNLMETNHIASNEIGIYFTSTSKDNLISRNNITANTKDGVNLWGSTNTSLTENNFTLNIETGINLFDSCNNKIAANTIAENIGIGIKLWYNSNENHFSANNIRNNNIGILINDSFDNLIIENNVRDNAEWGMRFEGDQNNNVIWQNNFINNRPAGDGLQVSVTGTGILEPRPGGGNIWDNGTAGNHWSDYTARYPNATQTGSSGTGNTPYLINENNIDHHPLIAPYNNLTPNPPQTPAPSQPPTSTTSNSPNPTPSPSIPEFPVGMLILFSLLAVSTLVLVVPRVRRH